MLKTNPAPLDPTTTTPVVFCNILMINREALVALGF